MAAPGRNSTPYQAGDMGFAKYERKYVPWATDVGKSNDLGFFIREHAHTSGKSSDRGQTGDLGFKMTHGRRPNPLLCGEKQNPCALPTCGATTGLGVPESPTFIAAAPGPQYPGFQVFSAPKPTTRNAAVGAERASAPAASGKYDAFWANQKSFNIQLTPTQVTPLQGAPLPVILTPVIAPAPAAVEPAVAPLEEQTVLSIPASA